MKFNLFLANEKHRQSQNVCLFCTFSVFRLALGDCDYYFNKAAITHQQRQQFTTRLIMAMSCSMEWHGVMPGAHRTTSNQVTARSCRLEFDTIVGLARPTVFEMAVMWSLVGSYASICQRCDVWACTHTCATFSIVVACASCLCSKIVSKRVT